jgi:hypothetical protein
MGCHVGKPACQPKFVVTDRGPYNYISDPGEDIWPCYMVNDKTVITQPQYGKVTVPCTEQYQWQMWSGEKTAILWALQRGK